MTSCDILGSQQEEEREPGNAISTDRNTSQNSSPDQESGRVARPRGTLPAGEALP